MKVKSLIGRHAGQILEVPHNVGENLIQQGQAEAVSDEEPTDIETAEAVSGTEKAVARRGRAKK